MMELTVGCADSMVVAKLQGQGWVDGIKKRWENLDNAVNKC